MNRISVGRMERDKICRTRHMFTPPSVAQTLAHSACRVIQQPKSRRAHAGWPAGGTEGQSIMKELRTADRTDDEVDTERYEWAKGQRTDYGCRGKSKFKKKKKTGGAENEWTWRKKSVVKMLEGTEAVRWKEKRNGLWEQTEEYEVWTKPNSCGSFFKLFLHTM